MEETAAALERTQVREVMARRLVTTTEDAPPSEVLAKMVNLGVHPIPVVAGDRLTGLLSRGDLVGVLLRAAQPAAEAP